ncbi:MAG: xanthine dehydrogenase family protein molybdopterin-binding subunit [Actinomycetota bacterium]
MSVGHSSVRRDAAAKVDGSAAYAADVVPPEALHAVIVFSGRAHARMISMSTTAARAIDGVVDVITAADAPVNEYGLTMLDQPALVGVDHTGMAPVDASISRWEADQIAVVIGETAAAARAGAAALDVIWEDLPLVTDIDQALEPAAPLLHPENGLDTNAYHHLKIRKGDIDFGWAVADVVVDDTYEVPHQEHAYLQPEAGTSYIDDEGRVTIEVGGQWTTEDREQVAHVLGLPEAQVRIVYKAVGGAFGGKEDMSIQIALGLATLRLAERGEHRPIHCRWSREESIVGHHKRHRGRIRLRLGATSEGEITALEADVDLDAGAYNYTSNKVLGNAHLSVAGPYRIPNARIDSRAIYTTSVPGGAFRGFGGPQGHFAIETALNKLAERLGIDPVELRLRNALRDGDASITQAPMPDGVSIREVITACSMRADLGEPFGEPEPFSPIASLPSAPDALRNGRGFAAGFKNVGFSFGFPERCEAEIVLHGSPDDETPTHVDLYHGGAEVGQGHHHAMLQIAADATGVELDLVDGHFSDTATSGDPGSASASRLTFMAGNSILGAAEEAEKAWRDGSRPARGFFRYTPPPTEALDADTGTGAPNFCIGYLAQCVEVTVDIDTGHIRVDRVTSTHDVGAAINPRLVQGQIEGAVVQAHGYTLSEDLQLVDGFITNPRFSGYLIPGIGDIPLEVDSQILEFADPLGPFGARGVAEMPFIAYAPALIAAVHDATGVWFDSFPLTPSRVLEGLRGLSTPTV